MISRPSSAFTKPVARTGVPGGQTGKNPIPPSKKRSRFFLKTAPNSGWKGISTKYFHGFCCKSALVIQCVFTHIKPKFCIVPQKKISWRLSGTNAGATEANQQNSFMLLGAAGSGKILWDICNILIPQVPYGKQVKAVHLTVFPFYDFLETYLDAFKNTP